MGILLAIPLTCLVAVEVYFSIRNYFYWKRRNQRATPSYSWSFHTPSGQRISAEQGLLRLRVHPVAVYANAPSQSTAFFHINRLGYRGQDVLGQRSPKKRVVLLGSSMAFGSGLLRDEDSLACQWEKRNPDIEVINAAVIGYVSGQELSLLAYEILDLKPDQVIVLNGANDFLSLGAARNHDWIDVNGLGQIQHELDQWHSMKYANVAQRMAASVGSLFTHTFQAFEKNKRRRTTPSKGQQVDASLFRTSIERYGRNLICMKRLCDGYGIGFHVVFQPSKKEISQEPRKARCQFTYREYLGAVKTSISDVIPHTLDLNEMKDALRRDYFLDELHMDARGHAQCAEILHEQIAISMLREGQRVTS